MVNNISPVDSSKSLLIKCADDVSLSVPVKDYSNDASALLVESVQQWSVENKMKLNLNSKKTLVMVGKGRTSKVSPKRISGIERKS